MEKQRLWSFCGLVSTSSQLVHSCVMVHTPFLATWLFSVSARSNMLCHLSPAYQFPTFLYLPNYRKKNHLMLFNHIYPLFGGCSFAPAIWFDPHKSTCRCLPWNPNLNQVPHSHIILCFSSCSLAQYVRL